MDFKIKERPNPNLGNYNPNDMTIVRNFARELHKEYGGFIKGVVIFGSAAKGMRSKKGDIDVLVIVDDISIQMTSEVVEAYRIITENAVNKISTKLHVISLKFTTFWDYVRNGDPVIINILRDGVPIMDQNFFAPIQYLLKQGRIRPTMEAIQSYFERSPKTLYNSKWHIMQATLDLYWAVTDSAHAALMIKEIIPPAPAHIADLMQTELVDKNILEQKHVATVRKFYNLMKMITHREIKEITGPDYDEYYKEAENFVNVMEKIVKHSN